MNEMSIKNTSLWGKHALLSYTSENRKAVHMAKKDSLSVLKSKLIREENLE